MNSIKTVLQEQINNLSLIFRLSSYETRKEYADSQLGVIWVFLNPLFQIAVYWITFGTGIRGGAPVNGIPFLIWMLCGLIPWFFISNSIMQGSSSIFNRIGTVSKMNFPLSIIPTYVVLSRFNTHVFMMGVLFIGVVVSQGFDQMNIIALIYFMIVGLLFNIALGLFTSTLSTMIRDIHLFIQSFTRMLLYLTPILWEPSRGSGASKILFFIMKLNPFYYIVEGYRGALLYGHSDIIFSKYTVYFWAVLIIIFTIGSIFHIKFRKQFVDFL
ncbi:ABC transporter permease [Bacillus sp. AFS053548]|uniref:ABC transporter permease n=1 Tax=Bacillus sp. AFS053548 TaxID=2033505 RepID=UPI000BFBB03A|nr:ABC transporter permease [Bacillus sp. AFS053548]PGM56721.1 teichoic acid ABC transporter permease [Bacillus sp. AFS053548]